MPNLNLLLLNKVKVKKLNIPWKPTQTCIPARTQLKPVIWQSFGPFLTGNLSENPTRYNSTNNRSSSYSRNNLGSNSVFVFLQYIVSIVK